MGSALYVFYGGECKKNSTLYLALPVTGCVERFGCRAVTIAMSALTAASFFSSFFINNIIVLYITVGIIAGKSDALYLRVIL